MSHNNCFNATSLLLHYHSPAEFLYHIPGNYLPHFDCFPATPQQLPCRIPVALLTHPVWYLVPQTHPSCFLTVSLQLLYQSLAALRPHSCPSSYIAYLSYSHHYSITSLLNLSYCPDIFLYHLPHSFTSSTYQLFPWIPHSCTCFISQAASLPHPRSF